MNRANLFSIITSCNRNNALQIQNQVACSQPVNYRILRTFKHYQNFLYYMLVSPFRIEYDVTLKKLKIVTRSPQKTLMVIVFILDFFWLFRIVRSAYPKKTESPSHILSFIYWLVSSGRLVYPVTIFWFGQDHFQKLLNYIATSKFDMVRTRTGKTFFSRCFPLGFIFFWTLMFLHSIVTAPFSNYSQISFVGWTFKILIKSRGTYFIGTPYLFSETWVVVDYFLFIIGVISSLHLAIILYGIWQLLLVCSMIMWTGASSFSAYLGSSNYHSWKNVKHNYDVIYSLSAHLNMCVSFRLI